MVRTAIALAFLTLLQAPVCASDTTAIPPRIDSTPFLPAGAPKPDSTPVSKVDPVLAGGASLLVPGAGQWLTHHPVRGSIGGVLTVWLYADAWQRTNTGIPKLRDEREAIAVRANQMRVLLDSLGDTTSTSHAKWAKLEDSVSVARGKVRISQDYRNSELAWALGVHAYLVVDAAEAAWRNNHPGPKPVRSMSGAIWRSALVPGLGQVWNGRPAKATLLWMGISGSVVSAISRQEMVDFWKQEEQLAVAQKRPEGLSYASEQADFFRKRRNQYLWGLGLVYIYQILDAAVDARLSRVEQPFGLEVQLLPASVPGVQVAWSF